MDIDTIDWREAWADYQQYRRAADNADFWNARAKSFAAKAGTSPYAAEFLQLADVREGESVLDMGCGSGTLAIPLAQAGHQVWACDFSSAMLEQLEAAAQAAGVLERIHPMLVSWSDDWDALGVPLCDVALASRSMAADDLTDAIEKLSSRARRRACVTMGTNHSPRYDAVLLAAVGRSMRKLPEFVYAMNILWRLGKRPELRNITSQREELFDCPEDAVRKHAGIMECTPEEEQALRGYASQHLLEVSTPEGVKWKFDHQRVNSWAFISW